MEAGTNLAQLSCKNIYQKLLLEMLTKPYQLSVYFD